MEMAYNVKVLPPTSHHTSLEQEHGKILTNLSLMILSITWQIIMMIIYLTHLVRYYTTFLLVQDRNLHRI